MNWKKKVLHEKFNRQREEIGTDESRRWLKNGFLKKEPEGLKAEGLRCKC